MAAPARQTVRRAPELDATDEAIGEDIVRGMNAVETSPVGPDTGVFYVHNYEPLAQKGQQYLDNSVTYAKYKKYREYAQFWKDDYRNGYADPAYWERTAFMTWQIKDGVSAAAAIKAWVEGLTIAECYTTLLAIETDTLRKTVGDENFDYVYGTLPTSQGDKKLTIAFPGKGSSSVNQVLKSTERALKAREEQKQSKDHSLQTAGKAGDRPMKVGEWIYFYNHPKYLLKHPGGAFQGENAVYMGKRKSDKAQLFSGFGMHLKTEQEMYETMVSAYDADRDEDDYRDLVEDFAKDKIKLEENKGASWEELYTKYKSQVPDIYREDKGHFPKKINTVKKLLEAAPYKIGKTTRQGGFVPISGKALKASSIKKAVPRFTKQRLEAVDYSQKSPTACLDAFLNVVQMANSELASLDRQTICTTIVNAIRDKPFTNATGAAMQFYRELVQRQGLYAEDLRPAREGLAQRIRQRNVRVRVVLKKGYRFSDRVLVAVTSANHAKVESGKHWIKLINDSFTEDWTMGDLVDFTAGSITASRTVRLTRSPRLGSDSEVGNLAWDPKSDAPHQATVGDYSINVYYRY